MNKMFQTAMIAEAMATGFMVFSDSKTQRKMNRKMHQVKRKVMKKL